jgi:hypothetical protein
LPDESTNVKSAAAAGKAGYDNDMCESYNAILKSSSVNCLSRIDSGTSAKQCWPFDFLERFYYPCRRDTFIGSIAPIEFEHGTHAA